MRLGGKSRQSADKRDERESEFFASKHEFLKQLGPVKGKKKG